MSQNNVEILRRCAELLNVGDWDAVLELYHPDVHVEFRDLPSPDMPEVLQGREAIRRVAAHWTAPYDEFGAEIYEYIDAHPRSHGKSKGSDVSIDVRFVDAYEVKDGKIVRAIVGYPDVATAFEAVGPAK
jgi:ketosteroid isomerase-like protein